MNQGWGTGPEGQRHGPQGEPYDPEGQGVQDGGAGQGEGSGPGGPGAEGGYGAQGYGDAAGPGPQGYGGAGGPGAEGYGPQGDGAQGYGPGYGYGGDVSGGYGPAGYGPEGYGPEGYGPATGYGPDGNGPAAGYGPVPDGYGPADGNGYGPGQSGWAGQEPGADEGDRQVLEGTVIPSRPRRALPPLYQPRSPQEQQAAQQQASQEPASQQPASQQGASGPQTAPHAFGQQGAGPQAQPGAGGQQDGAPGSPGWRPPESFSSPGEPDWDALASANEGRARRRRLLMIGGGVLAAAAVAGIVAVAVAKSGGGGKPAAGARPTPSDSVTNPQFPEVTQPPPPDPLDYISSAGKDTAPLTADTLFIGKRMSIGPRAYTKAITGGTTNCASVTQGGLGAVLTSNGCREVLRATYLRDGRAVTVGVAVFDTAREAARARDQSTGNIAALPGGGVGTFCRPVACWRTTNAVGRYAYFTIAGPSDGKAAATTDTLSKQAGRDAGTFAFNRIVQRGRDAAVHPAGG
jgi:hypothetical protein